MFKSIARLNNIALVRTFARSTIAQTEKTANNTVVSSCKAGTPLNLKIKKTGDEPVALQDSEYPSWLWSVLDEKVPDVMPTNISKDEELALRKKQLRIANRLKIKNRNTFG